MIIVMTRRLARQRTATKPAAPSRYLLTSALFPIAIDRNDAADRCEGRPLPVAGVQPFTRWP
jgi:hypothetical protein